MSKTLLALFRGGYSMMAGNNGLFCMDPKGHLCGVSLSESEIKEIRKELQEIYDEINKDELDGE